MVYGDGFHDEVDMPTTVYPLFQNPVSLGEIKFRNRAGQSDDKSQGASDLTAPGKVAGKRIIKQVGNKLTWGEAPSTTPLKSKCTHTINT
jgi:hypothetical protein